jgi:hypothetical protein
MSENSENNNTIIKKGRGRPRKEKPVVVDSVKKTLGRPKVHPEGARAHRDSQHRTYIDRERLNELLAIEHKYNLLTVF